MVSKTGSGDSLSQKPGCPILPLPHSHSLSWPISSCVCLFGLKGKEERGDSELLQFIPSPGKGEWTSCRHWLFCMSVVLHVRGCSKAKR